MPISEQLIASFRRPRRMAREPYQPDPAAPVAAPTSTPGRSTKIRVVLDLLQQPAGCSLEDLIAATGWQPHTTRAALTGLRRKGHQIASLKSECGSRIYRIVPVEPSL